MGEMFTESIIIYTEIKQYNIPYKVVSVVFHNRNKYE